MTRGSDFKDWSDEDIRDLAEMLADRDYQFIVGFFEELRDAEPPRKKRK